MKNSHSIHRYYAQYFGHDSLRYFEAINIAVLCNKLSLLFASLYLLYKYSHISNWPHRLRQGRYFQHLSCSFVVLFEMKTDYMLLKVPQNSRINNVTEWLRLLLPIGRRRIRLSTRRGTWKVDIFRIYPKYSQGDAGVVIKTNSRWFSFHVFSNLLS